MGRILLGVPMRYGVLPRGLGRPILSLGLAAIASGVLYRKRDRANKAQLDNHSQTAIYRAAVQSAPIISIGEDMVIMVASESFAELIKIDQYALLGTNAVSLLSNFRGAEVSRYSINIKGPPSFDVLDLAKGDGANIRVAAFSRWSEKVGQRIISFAEIEKNHRFHTVRSDFVATVSHELRTPLSSVSGALGLVDAGLTGELSEDSREMIKIALNNTSRLIKLIDDLLDVEGIESGRLHLDTHKYSLGRIVKTAVDDIRSFSDEHGVSIVFCSNLENDQILVDADRAVQVFTNLLSNAIKFSPKPGTVTIDIVRKAPYYRVCVIDDGPGVPEKFRPYIFGKFAQADRWNSRKVGGTGLGLAISREIVQRLDGKIWFMDRPSGGAIFAVELPIPAGS